MKDNNKKQNQHKNIYVHIYKVFFIFVVVFLCTFIFIINYFINGEKEINYLENRTKTRLSDIKPTNLIDSSFQNQIENFLLDQFPNGEKIKKTYLNITNSQIIRNIFNHSDSDLNKVEIRDEIFVMGEERYMMWQEYGIGLFYVNSSNLLQFINEDIGDIDKYLYFINDSRTIQDIGGDVNNEYFIYLKDFLNNTKVSQLDIKNFDDYKYYFFKSDHHWNLYGAYQGYKDIINLMLDDETIIIPNKEIKLANNYCGSFCRLIGYHNSEDQFSIYDYNYPQIKTYINGSLSNYGHEFDYLYNGWELHEDENYYGAVYGGNYGELVFDTENPEKDNVLILSFSYINPIAKLIASHFNRTHIIDIRNYYSDLGTDFNIKEYVKDNHINKVLFVGDIDTLVTINQWIKGE